MTRRIIATLTLTAALGLVSAGPALADQAPGGPGRPNQSCQDVEPNTPGHSADSPGSPFNEPGINSVAGGIGGQHYSETSQYDVACYQQSVH
jgi:hypothetical protein